MTARAILSILLAMVAFPALINATLGKSWHTVAQIALLALVLVNVSRRAET